MKFALPTFSCGAYTLAAVLLLGFSAPMVMPILASENTDACSSLESARQNTPEDLSSIRRYQQECEKASFAALSSATQAIRLNPKDEEAYYQRGNSYQQLGNYKAAVADYTEVINLNTGKFGHSHVAYWQRARAYDKLGEKQKAISDMNKIIAKDSVNADDYLFRAKLYKDLGDKQKAIADYKAADNLLQQGLNGVFGNGLMDSYYEKMLNQARNELSQIGVSLPAPQLKTRQLLQSIPKIEVERALNLARYSPQHPAIKQFDTQLQDLYQQLAISQPQPHKGTLKALVSNAAYEKLNGLEKERAQLIKQFTSDHPAIKSIDTQINKLKILADRNKHVPSDSDNQQSYSKEELQEVLQWEAKMTEELFKYWFKGVEMAPEQEKFARAEHARYHQGLKKFGAEDRDLVPSSFISWVMGNGRYIWTGTKALEFEKNFQVYYLTTETQSTQRGVGGIKVLI